MSLIARILPDNPVLTKEMRVRMRGAKAYWILLGYLGFLALLLLFRYWNFNADIITNNGVGGSQSAHLGSELFLWIMIPQIFLVLFITPAITSGSITIEREQQTMEMLSMTRLSRRSIVSGKLLSAVSFTALLIISSLPLLSVCFMLGSIDPAQVVSVYLELLAGSMLIGAMGLMWSSIARTTTSAVILTYITLFLVALFGCGVFASHQGPGNGGVLAADLFSALGNTWFSDTFFGLKIIEGIGFAILSLMAGCLMTAVATVRLEMFPDRKAYILRGLTLLLISVQLLALNSAWIGWFYHFKNQISSKQSPSGVLVLTALTLILLIPIFATGDVASFEARKFWKYLGGGWTIKGLRRGKLASGLPFLVLATLLCLTLYAIPFLFLGKAQDIFRSGALNQGITNTSVNAGITWDGQPVTVLNTQNLPSGQVVYSMLASDNSPIQAVTVNGQILSITVNNSPVNPASSGLVIPKPGAPVKTLREPTGDVGQGAIALLATIAGFSLFCMFLSVAFRSRWVALLVAYVLMLLVFIVPETTMSGMSGPHDPSLWSLLVNLFYLNPMQAFLQISEPDAYWTGRWLMFGHAPLWQVTTWLWLGIGALSLLATLPFVRREAQRNAPIPYEELVAEA